MFELASDDVRALADLGFMALSRGLNDKAEVIFAGVRAARPAQAAGFIGGALVDLARGDIARAIKTLRALPPSDTARTFLAMALNRNGDRATAREILTNVVRTAGSSADAHLARQMLAEFDDAKASPFR